VPAEHRETGAVGGEGEAVEDKLDEEIAALDCLDPDDIEALDPADAPRQVARPGPRRVRRGPREGLLRRRQGQRTTCLPLLPRQLALQGAFHTTLPTAVKLMRAFDPDLM
jgi:hypothetical protein